MTIDGFGYFEKEKAGNALIERCKKMTSEEPVNIGDYRGFSMELSFDSFQKIIYVSLKNEFSHKVELGTDVFGNIQRIDNAIDGLEKGLKYPKRSLQTPIRSLKRQRLKQSDRFRRRRNYREKTKRLAAVEVLLKMDKKDDNVIDTEISDDDAPIKNGNMLWKDEIYFFDKGNTDIYNMKKNQYCEVNTLDKSKNRTMIQNRYAHGRNAF